MTPSSKIYAPNVYLFAFHLCNSLESESNSPVEFASLWQKCDQIFQAKLAVSPKFNDSYLHKKDEPVGGCVNLIDKQVVGDRNSLPFAIDLQFRENTIAINAQNYQNKLNQISLDIAEAKKYNDRDADLSFLAAFGTQNCPQFQRQIQADLGYFKHGSGLLAQATEAIRAVVAIEEAYRDAKLEVTIQAVGFGLGMAGVVAGSAPYLIKQDAPSQKFYWPLIKVEIHPFVLVLLISIGAGVAVWGVVLLLANFKHILAKFKRRT
jgi:hypothetical protein